MQTMARWQSFDVPVRAESGHIQSMILRRAHHTDAPVIAALSIEVWLGTYLERGMNAFFANYVLNEFTAAKTEALLTDPAQFILVSENKEGIDGFIRLTSGSLAPVDGGSDLEIATFYVQPRHHGKGIGKRLLDAAIEHAHRSSASSVWLTTNAQNSSAISFYLAQRFIQVGETHFTISEQAYLNNVYSRRLSYKRPTISN